MSSAVKSDREVLEDAIAADFEDFAAHAAYADLLAEHGDPRGEYIQLMLALEDVGRPVDERRRAQERAFALSQAHRDAWLGELAGVLFPPQRRRTPEPVAPNVEPTFRRGWLTGLEVFQVRDELLEVLARAPQCRMMQELILLSTQIHPAPSLRRLVDSPYFTTLRHLELGDPNSPLCTADGTDAVALVQKNPRLRKLVLLARNIDTETLFTLPMPQLERLWVDFGARYPLRRLAENASLRNLTHLWLDPRPEYPLAPVNPGEMDELELVEAIMEREQSTDLTPEVHTPEEVDSFFASPNFPKVAHLRLRLTGIGDWACEAVVRHGWLRRLETLDLCQTGMTDEGAHALARCPDLGRLKQLDVQGNRLTRDGIAALERADIRLHARYQIGGAGYPEDDDFGFGGGPTGIEVIDL